MFDKFKNYFKGYEASGPVEWLVAGLGNPGREYENTRHNAGFRAVDHITGKLGVNATRLKFQSLCGDGMLGGKRVLFLKPSTFMNRSGQAVRDAAGFYKLPMERVLVISDDVSLEVGRLRIRRSGSDGGQKGLQNIIYLTGSDAFPRIRIGVGKKPHPDMDLADWVLSRFTPADEKQLEPLWQSVMDAAELVIQGRINEAMNRFN